MISPPFAEYNINFVTFILYDKMSYKSIRIFYKKFGYNLSKYDIASYGGRFKYDKMS